MAPQISPSDNVFSYPVLPQLKTYDHVNFPLVLSPPSSPSSSQKDLETDATFVCAYLKQHQPLLKQLLQQHGVLFFRGFADKTSTAFDFARFVTDGLDFKPFPYKLGNAVRTKIVGDIVFTANEAPPSKPIPFHHELAQTPCFPDALLFYCDVPATTGGETPVVHSHVVYSKLSTEFTEKLETYGVVYRRSMTEHDRADSAIGRGWRNTFGVTTKAEAEMKLKEKGYSWEWSKVHENVLTEISPRLDAIVKTKHGKKVFFNQIFAAWAGWRDEYNEPGEAVRFGNGQKFKYDDMTALQKVLEEEEVAIPWQRGDFMLVDNIQAMHSRRSFTGKRVVLASLVK